METPIPRSLPTAPSLVHLGDSAADSSNGSSGARSAASAEAPEKMLADVADLPFPSRSPAVPGMPALFAPLYDFLSDSLTAAQPDGEPAIVDALRSHLSLLFPGMPLAAGAFVNPWSPKNPEGDQLAAENLARLSDGVPTFSPVHTESGQSLDKVYGRLVCADVFSDPSASAEPRKAAAYSRRTRLFAPRRPVAPGGLRPVAADRAASERAIRIERAGLARLQLLSPAQIGIQALAALPVAARDALKLLVHEAVDYDATGARIRVLDSSPRHEEYLQHRRQYEAAVLVLMARYRSLPACDAVDRQRWVAQAPGLEATLTKLRQRLISRDALQLEAALRVRDAASVRGGSVGVLFDAARLRYELTKRRGVQNPFALWHACQAAPGNWYEPSAEYAEARVLLGRPVSQADTGRTERALGMWRIGCPGQGGWSEQALSPNTRSLRVSFTFQRVQILRPWFEYTLLGLGSWSHTGQKRNTYSTGSGTDNAGSFPLLPVAMIVARDVELTADWSPEDQELLTSCLTQGRRLALGPFVLSGSYGSGKEEYRLPSSQRDRTVRAPGLQLLGWLSDIVPASPPLDG